MLIENKSKYYLKKVRAKSKMFEYDVPIENHIEVEYMAKELIILAMATVGDSCNFIWDNRYTDNHLTLSNDLLYNLNFSSVYFDSLITSKIGVTDFDDYYGLLGAISFYLSDSLGSAKVMLNKIDWSIDLNVNRIDTFLLYLLSDRLEELKDYKFDSEYKLFFYEMIEDYTQFYSLGKTFDFERLEKLKDIIYSFHNPREILLGDALLAVFIKKYKNAALNLLPRFSNTLISDWESLLLNNTIIKELWPSQIMLGEANIFNGKSCIIQMPTSSGKTTSIGLIIRSAFITKRTTIAVVVAPFKALCKEITLNLMDFFKNDEITINELSDIAEKEDLAFFENGENTNKLIVLTPEKLLFLIRNNSEILEKLNLIIFDEAHLFDDNSRGTNYELLISTIKYYLKEDSQKILISAVIVNSFAINAWLNGNSGTVISNNNIISSQRSIAMGDWIGHTGQLYFLNQENPDIDDFYVPRIVDIQEINKLDGERNKRYFPDVNFNTHKMNQSHDMQIYYALKLVHNGATAIFAGTKNTADNTIKRLINLDMRGLDISVFSQNIIDNEHRKIANLIRLNLGTENDYYNSALIGVFIHHGRIPFGIRLSIEYAMSHNLISCVVCTSTLAQGVNLPIKYLIIPNLYQGQSQIKVRDFHNLLGRTGRAGKHIEGTVILSEPFVHSKKRNWKWKQYRSMLDITNSEESVSNLLKLVRPIVISNLPPINLWDTILLKYSDLGQFNHRINILKESIQESYSDAYPTFNNELQTILSSLNDIENYIMYFMNSFGEDEVDFTSIVTQQTLGYHLANENEKEKLIQLFDSIKHNSLLLTKEELDLYSITFLGFDNSRLLSQWISESIEVITQVNSDNELITIIFPQLIKYSDNNIIDKVTDKSIFSRICQLWIQGLSYIEMLAYSQEQQFQITKRNRQVPISLQDVIELCDNVLAYSTILPLNGIITYINSEDEDNPSIQVIKTFQKKIRYGLPCILSINIFELGFSDRSVAQIMAKIIIESSHQSIRMNSKEMTRRLIRENRQELTEALIGLPRYFLDTLKLI